jgi:hypothetical protein
MKTKSQLPITHATSITGGATKKQSRISSLLVLAVTVLLPARFAVAADAKLPSAQELFAGHVKAIGGKAAVLKVPGMRVKGHFSIASANMNGEIEIMGAKPNKQVVRSTIPGVGVVAGGYDGEVGWSIDPSLGPLVLEGRMLDQAHDNAQFYSQFQLHDGDFTSAETVAKTTFAGQDCYQVKAVWKSGREETLFFNTKTGLCAGGRRMQETEQNSSEIMNVLSDYKKCGDILQPTKILTKVSDVEIVITITEARFEAVPDKELALPEAVRKLLSGAWAK